MEFQYYVIRRLLSIIPVLIGLSIITFVLMRSLPDNYLISQYINPRSTVPLSVQAANAKVALGLNEPVFVQYFYYLSNLIKGNMGYMSTTFYTGPVLRGIELFFPNTLQLVILSLIISILIAVPVGTYIGNNRNSISDHVTRVFSLTGYALPPFWLALMLQLVFGRHVLNWFGAVLPISGAFPSLPVVLPSWIILMDGGSVIVSTPTHMIFFDALIHGAWGIALGAFEHLILPVLTLTYIILAGLLRFLRSGIIDASNQQYVTTARSKGLDEKVILKRHIRKNAMIPFTTVLGLLTAYMLGGVVLVELVFQYPGMGLLTLYSALQLSIYGIIGTTLVFGLFMVLANFVVDIVLALLDPRIRY